MKLKVPQIFGQRDARWSSILLGYNTQSQYTIGMYGCLITCLGMYINQTPDIVNQTLKDNRGFDAQWNADGTVKSGTGTGNFIWSKCTTLGLTQTYLSPYYDGPVTSQGIQKIKDLLDQGYPLLCEIDFNPATIGEEMHYVLLMGYDDTNIYCADPWQGKIVSLDVYGGPQRAIIQFRAYDKKLAIDSGVVDPNQEIITRADAFVAVCTELKVDVNKDLAIAEIKKFDGLSDRLQEQTRINTDLQAQVKQAKEDLQKQISTDTESLQKVNTALGEIQEKYEKLQKDYTLSQNNNSDLLNRITDLEKAIVAPVRKGWKAFLVSLVDKL